METKKISLWQLVLCFLGYNVVWGHQNVQFGQPPQQQHMHNIPQAQHTQSPPGGTQQPHAGHVFDKTQVHDREHIKEHLEGVIQQPDTSKMTDQELQFHYFKMHDNDNNNKLDGSELIKSLIHWHVHEGQNPNTNAPPKIFTDIELAMLIDPILNSDDINQDGLIDYPEFAAAQARMAAQSA